MSARAGTKLAISEYNWGALDHINGALAQADVLGIFGREGLDLATLWDPPTASQPGAFAFRMYLNYDGTRSRFGDVSIAAASTDQSQLAHYAAQDGATGTLKLMMINKSGQALTSTVTLANFNAAASAQVYRYSAANLGAIVRDPDQPVSPTGFTATFPSASITLIVLPSSGTTPAATQTQPAIPTMTPSPSRTPTPTVSRTPTPTASRTPTATQTPTRTPTASRTPTFTPTRPPTATRTPTRTRGSTPTPTPTRRRHR